MTQRQALEHKLHTFTEIRKIMGAMKNLAMVEIRKLNRMRGSHGQVVRTLQSALADFFYYHPHLYPEPGKTRPFILLVGSERGFCGNFNGILMESVDERLRQGTPGPGDFIAIGHKLSMRLESDPRVIQSLNGPTSAEEVHLVLDDVLSAVRTQQFTRSPGQPLVLWAAYHDMEIKGVVLEELTAFPQPATPPGYATPPLLTMVPEALIAELITHYLFTLLTHVFYTSLMAENRHRLAHMENATRLLGQKTEELTLRRNLLRQEEITQEVSMILLSGEPAGEL